MRDGWGSMCTSRWRREATHSISGQAVCQVVGQAVSWLSVTVDTSVAARCAPHGSSCGSCPRAPGLHSQVHDFDRRARILLKPTSVQWPGKPLSERTVGERTSDPSAYYRAHGAKVRTPTPLREMLRHKCSFGPNCSVPWSVVARFPPVPEAMQLGAAGAERPRTLRRRPAPPASMRGSNTERACPHCLSN